MGCLRPRIDHLHETSGHDRQGGVANSELHLGHQRKRGLLRQYFPRAPTSRSTPLPTSTGSPPNSTTGPANGSDSANRSNRSLTCCWLGEDHPAQPFAPGHTCASFLIAASPDAAPEESRWSPRSRAAARRNDLDSDQRQPTIRRRGRTRPTSAKPCQGSSGNATHTSFNHRGTIAGSRVTCYHRQHPPFR